MKTKICIFTILLAAGLTSSHAQDTWTPKADFGGTARGFATGFSISSKGYMGTGSDVSNSYADFWEYDPATNAWSQKADFGGTARYFAVGFSIGSTGYIGTGYDGFSSFKDFWEYDPATNVWVQKADFGGTARWGAVGFPIGSKGYIGTGFHGYFACADFWEYDPATNAWSQKADFAGTARFLAAGFSIGSKGYIGTGYNGLPSFKDFWEYDPATNAWTQKADFGGTARSNATGFSIGSKGYIGTGENDSFIGVKDFWEYDPATNIWTQKADFGGTARQLATGFSIGSKGYIGTGSSGSYPYLYYKDFWEYTPESAAAYRDVILADNPIMYWRLGETGGTIAYDETANHRDATYVHQPTHGLDGAIANDPNTSVRFNGFCQWVGWIPTSSYSGEFTVEAWVNEKRVRPIETFFNTRAATSDFSFDFKFDTLAGKEIRFDIGDGIQWLSTSALPFNFQPHVWYYVAAVVTTNGATYYVDGSALGSVTYNGTPLLFDAIHKVEIGYDAGLKLEAFDGGIDEVAVYDYALTAEQIAAHYATGTGN